MTLNSEAFIGKNPLPARQVPLSLCAGRGVRGEGPLRRLSRPQRGQGIIEFALVLPIFLLVVFGLFDLGRIVFLKVELENAVREGARAGMVLPHPLDSASQNAVAQRVKTQPGLASATVTFPHNDASRLTVTATQPVQVLVGLVPALPSPNLTASASVRLD